MKVQIDFHKAPSVSEWTGVLSEEEWQILRHNNDVVEVKRKVAINEYPPPKGTVTWYCSVRDNNASGVAVTVDVPAYADCVYARRRLQRQIFELSEEVPGPCHTDETMTDDVLSILE